MLKLGHCLWFEYDAPVSARLDLITKAGFTATFLWLGAGEEARLAREGKADSLPAMIRDRGLFLENLHAPFAHANYLWSPAKEDRQVIRQEYEDALRFCARHGIPTAVMHIVKGVSPPPFRSTGVDIIRGLVALAGDLGVNIALENTLHTAYLEPIFTEIPSPNLGLCYDCSSDFLAGHSRGGLLKRWGHLLKTTHISDAGGNREEHLQLGEGEIDWDVFVKAFPRDTYRGTLLAEIVNTGDNIIAEEHLKTTFSRLAALAGRLGNL
jgi:sugar phosphate isomerase/epimerase